MLELYRAGTDYEGDHAGPRAARGGVRARHRAAATRVRARRPSLDLAAPFERLTVADAFRRHAGVDLAACAGDAARLAAAARARRGTIRGRRARPFDDVFFRVMLDAVEPRLGLERPSSSSTGPPRWRRSRG